MDVGKSLTFITEDERWVSKVIILLIVSFFSFLIFPIFFLIGYAIGITRNVKDGVEKPLPEWEDWGKLFMDGLYIFIAQFVYTLPFLIIACIATVATGGLGALADSAAVLMRWRALFRHNRAHHWLFRLFVCDCFGLHQPSHHHSIRVAA